MHVLFCLLLTAVTLPDAKASQPASADFRAPSAESAWLSEHALALDARSRGAYANAEKHHQEAIRAAEKLGPGDMRLERSLTELGALLELRGDYAGAERVLARALSIRKAQFAPDSPEVAFGENNLAAADQELGRLQEAAALQTHAVEIARRQFPAYDPRLIPFLTRSAGLKRVHGDLPGAETVLREALAISEQQPVTKSANLDHAGILKYLGHTLLAAQKPTSAEAAFRKALSFEEDAVGMDTPQLVPLLNGIGDTLTAQQRYQEALPFLRRSLSLCEKQGIAESLTCSVTLNNLASVELSVGNISSAETHVRAALEGFAAAPGTHDHFTAAARNNLGQVFVAKRRYSAAEAQIRQAADLWKANGGAASADYATGLGNLAALYVSQRKYRKAEPLYREGIRIDQDIFGPRSLKVGSDLNRLAVALLSQKRLGEAEELLRRVIEIDSAQLSATHPVLAEPYLNLASLYQKQGRGDDALDYYRRGLQMMAASGRELAGPMAAILENYSDLLKERQQYAEAEKVSSQAAGIRFRQAAGASFR